MKAKFLNRTISEITMGLKLFLGIFIHLHNIFTPTLFYTVLTDDCSDHGTGIVQISVKNKHVNLCFI